MCVYIYIYIILTSISSVKWWGSGVRLEHFLSPPKKYEINGFLVPAFYSEVILAAIFMWS